MSGTTQTYVEYLMPGTFFAESETEKVSSRDITKLKIPKNAFGFQFFDVTSTVIDGEKLHGKPKNYSKRYLLAEEVLDKEGVKKKIKNNETLLSNMHYNDYKVVAQTRHGNIQPVDKDTVVVNSKGQIIYGTEAVEKKKPAKPAFKEAVLKKSITVGRPLKLKPLPDDIAPELRVPKADTPDNVVKKLRVPKA